MKMLDNIAIGAAILLSQGVYAYDVPQSDLGLYYTPTAYGGNGTATPNFCTNKYTGAACQWNTTTVNFANSVAQKKCRVCTQSTDNRCSLNYMNSILPTNHNVKAMYCNDKYLVVMSNPRGNFVDSLLDVPWPPGGTYWSSTSGSSVSCRTRSQTDGFTIAKFPLNPIALSTSSASNNIAFFTSSNQPYLTNSLSSSSWGLPADAGVATFVSGQWSWPIFNNRGQYTAQNCEVDACNQHTGQGGGPSHLHGDPFGPYCQYSAANYKTTEGVQSNNVHPPVVGWANDGYTIYGRYLSYSAPGYSTALDTCGGHTHDSYGYHYHTRMEIQATDSSAANNIFVTASLAATGTPYYTASPGVDQCFKGDLSKIDDYFYKGTAAVDYTAPCCGATNYYVASGIAIDGAGTQVTSGVAATTTSNAQVAALNPTCPAGYYKSGSACVACAGGTTSTAGSTSCTIICAAGTYASTGSTSCTTCPIGTYSAASASSCTTCTSGTYTAATGSSSCTTCTSGYYCTASSITKCAAGTYSAAGATSCITTSAGYYSAAGSSSATICAAGTYSAAGASACTSCASNYYSAAGSSICTICKSGYQCISPSPVACASGYYAASGATSCTKCAANYYSGATAPSCSACPNGKYVCSGLGTSSSSCVSPAPTCTSSNADADNANINTADNSGAATVGGVVGGVLLIAVVAAVVYKRRTAAPKFGKGQEMQKI